MDQNTFIELLFERAKAAGFEACEAYLHEGSSFEVAVNAGELTNYSVADSLNLGFRGLYRGRMGCASTQILDADAAQMLVDAAKSGAELCEGEDEEFIYAGSASYSDFDGAHPEIVALRASEKIDMVRTLEQKTLDFDPRVAAVNDCMLFTSSFAQRLVNSRGLDLCSHRDRMGAYVSAIAREGDRTVTADRECFAYNPAKLNLDVLAREAAAEAIAFLDASSVSSGSYPILLRPNVAAQLMSAFYTLFSADAAQKGMSLLAGREGAQIAAPCLSLVDDPLCPEGYASQAFDGEGVAARRTEVIERGTLHTLLHNLKTARKQGVETTGNAARASVAGPMTVAPSNLCIAPSTFDPTALRAGADGGILITDLMGLNSGANAVSGDFSLGAKGFLIRNGQIDRAVNQITIAGNFLELLQGIDAVGSDLTFSASHFASPTLLLRGLSVAGK